MALVDYTTFDDIRAALGVSSDELEDATLSLAVYEFNLKAELTDVGEDAVAGSDILADFKTADEVAPDIRTSQQARLVEGLRLFATYVVAKHLTSALPLFSPKEQHDGKASLVRYAQSPYADTIKSVKALYDRFRTQLVTAYTKFKSLTAAAPTARSYFSVVPSSSDPVTGA